MCDVEQFRPVELWEESACGSRKSIVSQRENAFLNFESSVVSNLYLLFSA
jgi:hypothetical protein